MVTESFVLETSERFLWLFSRSLRSGEVLSETCLEKSFEISDMRLLNKCSNISRVSRTEDGNENIELCHNHL